MDGIPILERLIDCLCQQGFTRLVVVVGYMEQNIREFLGKRRGSLMIDYVVNPKYRSTNNIYSLWSAREVIQEPFLLIESDLLFKSSLLRNLQQPDRIAISMMQPWMNGSTVTIDDLHRVRESQLNNVQETDELRYKTVNICSLSFQSWQRVIDRLDQYVVAGRVNEYYERVFADMVEDESLSFEAVVVEPRCWYEIDTLQDLENVDLFFKPDDSEQASPA